MLPVPFRMPFWVVVLSFLIAVPVAAQHSHGHSAVHTFRVDGLRVDDTAPPPGSAVGRAGVRFPDGGYVHVTHGKPYKRGREIFGGLVGFGKVWATGAHMATEIATTISLMVGGQMLEPGIYSLFTTPGPDRWTLHLNSALGMHLADEYDPANDVLTVETRVERLDAVVQALEIEFVPGHGSGVDLVIRWDQTAVRFPIQPR